MRPLKKTQVFPKENKKHFKAQKLRASQKNKEHNCPSCLRSCSWSICFQWELQLMQ